MLTCRYCQASFDGRHDRKGRILFGITPQEQEKEMATAATQHLQIRHPEQFAQFMSLAAMTVAQGSGLALMAHVDDDNPQAKPKQQMAQAVICQAFGRVVTDEDIVKALDSEIAAVANGSTYYSRAQVLHLLAQLRDTLSFADVTLPTPAAAESATT
jgi:hypothetical protein